jgi:hypothetical protein
MSKSNHKVEFLSYDGAWPNLCSGKLSIAVDDCLWEFPDYCLSSGGSVSFDDQWQADVMEGPWSIRKWPEGFPSDRNLRKQVVDAVNAHVRYGCCGGCV